MTFRATPVMYVTDSVHRLRYGGLDPDQKRKEAKMSTYIKWFNETGIDDVPEVGGKMPVSARCTGILPAKVYGYPTALP